MKTSQTEASESPSFVRESLQRINRSLNTIRSTGSVETDVLRANFSGPLAWEDDSFSWDDKGPDGPFNKHTDS